MTGVSSASASAVRSHPSRGSTGSRSARLARPSATFSPANDTPSEPIATKTGSPCATTPFSSRSSACWISSGHRRAFARHTEADETAGSGNRVHERLGLQERIGAPQCFDAVLDDRRRHLALASPRDLRSSTSSSSASPAQTCQPHASSAALSFISYSFGQQVRFDGTIWTTAPGLSAVKGPTCARASTTYPPGVFEHTSQCARLDARAGIPGSSVWPRTEAAAPAVERA